MTLRIGPARDGLDQSKATLTRLFAAGVGSAPAIARRLSVNRRTRLECGGQRVDAFSMTHARPERRYRITPGPTRLLIPLTALVAVLGLIHDGAAAAVPVPIILAAGYIYAAERCGLVATDDGIESRMTRRQNRFQRAWATDRQLRAARQWRSGRDRDPHARDGSRQVLPSTRAWLWNKRKVEHILAELSREKAAARAHQIG